MILFRLDNTSVILGYISYSFSVSVKKLKKYFTNQAINLVIFKSYKFDANKIINLESNPHFSNAVLKRN